MPHTSTQAPVTLRARFRDVPWLLLLAAVTLFAYRSTFSNGFTNWDDTTFILRNPALQALTLENVARIFRPAGGMLEAETLYYPITYLSYAIEHHFFGFDPRAFHATSLCLHIANVLLVYALFMRLTARRLLSLASAALFALHPVQVEVVAWAMARKDLLCTFFSLLFLIGYLKNAQRRNWAVYGASLLALVLAMLSKPAAIVVPVLPFLCDFLTKRDISRRSLLEKVPPLLIAVGFAMQSIFYVGAATAGIEVPLSEKLAMPLYVPWMGMTYLKNMLYPVRLAAVYPSPQPFPFGPAALGSAALFIALAVAVLASLRRTRIVFFGAAVCLVLVSPTFILIPKLNDFLVADRYIYFPALGLYFLAGAGIDAFFRRVGTGYVANAGTALLCLVALFLCQATDAQTRVWRDSVSLWNNQIEKYPDAMPPIPYYNRGIAEKRLGHFDAAIADLSKAVEMLPGYVDARRNRADLIFKTCCSKNGGSGDAQRLRLAIEDYGKILESHPRDVGAYTRRRAAFTKLRQLMEETHAQSR